MSKPKPKSLGQIAYEAHDKRLKHGPSWNELYEVRRSDYQAIARAVEREVKRRMKKR